MSVENKIKNYLDKDYKIKAYPSLTIFISA